MADAQALQEVLRNPAVWRARELAQEQEQRTDRTLGTGFSSLDLALPDGGWPVGALIELLADTSGVGELSLLLPTLRQVCAQGRAAALLAPPWLPYARAWESLGLPLDKLLMVESSSSDLLWSAEQILRSGECGAVVLWGQAAGRALDHRALQRLHLAASTGNALCFVYRATAVAEQPSPAPLRLKLRAQEGRLHLDFLKFRGALRNKSLLLDTYPAHWQPQPRLASQLETLSTPTYRPLRRSRSV